MIQDDFHPTEKIKMKKYKRNIMLRDELWKRYYNGMQ